MPRVNYIREAKCFENMKRRCYTPADKSYSYYGGRGIRVCDRWLNGFKYFLEDMGPAPSPLHTIDRVNNDGNYGPDNCRWATRAQQVSNQRIRRDNSSGHKGIRFQDNRWIVKFKGAYIGRFKSLEEAITARKGASDGTEITE